MAKVDVAAEILTSVVDVLTEYAPGRPAYLFGSRVTGLAHPESDLDLAIGGEPEMGSRQLSAIRCALEDKALPFEIDIVDLHETKGIFRKRIEAEWVLLSEAEPPVLVTA